MHSYFEHTTGTTAQHSFHILFAEVSDSLSLNAMDWWVAFLLVLLLSLQRITAVH